MSFLRPEATAFLTAWRGVIAGIGLCAVGVWTGLAANGILGFLGWFAAVLGVAQTIIAIQRKRFHHDQDGPGVVTIDEGQIAYFGPLSGGIVPIRDLRTVALDPTGKPVHWVLTPAEGAPVHIPVTASGTDVLFDAFAQLEGFSTARMLAALERPGKSIQILWNRNPIRQIGSSA